MIEWTEPTANGLKWPGPTWPEILVLPEPHEEITREQFLLLLLTSQYALEGINFGQGYPEKEHAQNEYVWAAHFFHFPGYTLAALERHITIYKNDWSLKPAEDSLWIKTGESFMHDEEGVEMRFYRCGCQHKRMERMGTVMFDNRSRCLDCGYIGGGWSD